MRVKQQVNFMDHLMKTRSGQPIFAQQVNKYDLFNNNAIEALAYLCRLVLKSLLEGYFAHLRSGWSAGWLGNSLYKKTYYYTRQHKSAVVETKFHILN